MAQQITTTQLVQLIQATSARMEHLIEPLSVAQMNQPGAVGIWSVKDALAHIAFWENYMVAMLQAIARGETPVVMVDDITERQNASVVAQYYLRPIGAVIADWHQAREDLIDLLEGLSLEDMYDPQRFAWSEGRPLISRIAGNTYEHEQEHIEQIQLWLDQQDQQPG
jgi:hypothetical protein